MKTYLFILLAVMISFMLACGGGPIKSDMADPNTIFVSASNDQLAKIPVKGFGYKSARVPAQNWDKWAEAAAPVVKGILDKLPDGYSLQVTGHTDASGPEEPVGRKPGNIKISTNRAKAVHVALKKKGVSSPSLTYKGIGSSEPIEGADPRDAGNRRVSFKVVPKE